MSLSHLIPNHDRVFNVKNTERGGAIQQSYTQGTW